MKLDKFDAIIFDFDGVIVDSKDIRINGFREIFKTYSKNLVDKLIEYHNKNGGISRYEKIKWFYKYIINDVPADHEINLKAKQFKSIMLEEMVDPDILIKQTLRFIEKCYGSIPLYIISGSDEEELKIICSKLKIEKYFISIEGSPTKKVDLIKDFIMKHTYLPEKILYIGDSLVDFKSAKANKVAFYGFNNKDLIPVSDFYIDSFSSCKDFI